MAATNGLFGIHAAALALRSQRMELLASNIANADTPGFKARDLDFKAALARALEGGLPGAPGGLALTDAQHLDSAGGPAMAAGADGVTIFRTPLQPSLDGNTVDAQQEHAAFAQAALEYQASLMFAESKVRGMLTAITGE